MASNKQTKRTSCIYIHHVPADLKSYFKAYCAKQEKTMKTVLLDFMRQCVKTARHIDEDMNYGTEE
jgi:hypothetical protein